MRLVHRRSQLCPQPPLSFIAPPWGFPNESPRNTDGEREPPELRPMLANANQHGHGERAEHDAAFHSRQTVLLA